MTDAESNYFCLGEPGDGVGKEIKYFLMYFCKEAWCPWIDFWQCTLGFESLYFGHISPRPPTHVLAPASGFQDLSCLTRDQTWALAVTVQES